MINTKKKKAILVYLSIIITFTFLCGVILYIVQPYLFFHPYHDAEAYESLQGKDAFQEITIPHGDGRLHGWLHRDSSTDTAPVLILYGGNMQNSSAWFRMFDNTDTFRWFKGYDVLFVDYPGYGLSDGRPTEKSLFSAALSVYDYAQSLDSTNGNIVLMGYSIGSGVATYVASRRNIDGLILLAPYDKGLSLYNDSLNIFHGPLKLLARFEFNSATYAKQIQVAPLILASQTDEVISYAHAVELSRHFRDVKELILLDGITHSGFLYSPQVLQSVQSYLLSIIQN